MKTHPDFLEIVFSGRNKEYGAYELRKNYNRRIKFALIFTLSIVSTLSLFSFAKREVPVTREVRMTEVTLQEIREPKKIEPIVEKKSSLPKTETKKFTPPVIKSDEEVKDLLPPTADLSDVKISTANQEGSKDEGTVEPTLLDEGKGIVEEKPEDENFVFEKVEIEASFPGGNAKWKQYLERNCNGQVASDNGAPEGTYTTIVQFVVDKEGNLSEIVALTNHGYGMEQEAIRVIKRGPKWNPAIQNGVQVKAYRKQLITFQVTGE